MNRIVEDYSLSAIARILGRAKSGLHKLAKSRQITALANGRYDLASVQAALAANVEPGRRRGVHLKSGEHLGEQPAREVNKQCLPPVSTIADAAEAVSLVRRVLRDEGVAVGKVDFNAARTAELILKSRERWLRFEVESGRLVDKATVEKQVFTFARQNRDALMNWPSQIGPLLAAELGVEQVKLVILLENYVRRHLEETSQPEWRLKAEAGK